MSLLDCDISSSRICIRTGTPVSVYSSHLSFIYGEAARHYHWSRLFPISKLELKPSQADRGAGCGRVEDIALPNLLLSLQALSRTSEVDLYLPRAEPAALQLAMIPPFDYFEHRAAW